MDLTSKKIPGYKGELLVSVDGEEYRRLGHLKTCDLSIARDTIDASDHDNNGWKDKMGGLREWSASANLILVPDDVGQDVITQVLLGEIGLQMNFYPAGNGAGKPMRQGVCVIKSYKEAYPNGDVVTLDVELEGRGELEFSTQVAAQAVVTTSYVPV